MQFGRMVDPVEQNLELIRKVLEAINADTRLDGMTYITPDETDPFGVIGSYSKQEVAYHLNILLAEKLITGKMDQPMPMVSGMTFDGYEFLKTTRNKDVWTKTKDILSGIPPIAITTIVDIAKAAFKKYYNLP